MYIIVTVKIVKISASVIFLILLVPKIFFLIMLILLLTKINIAPNNPPITPRTTAPKRLSRGGAF